MTTPKAARMAVPGAGIAKSAPKAKRRQLEAPIHAAVLAYLRAAFPGALIHHSANEVDQSGVQARTMVARAKRLGMVVGFPDLMMLHKGEFFGFEVKAPGGVLSEQQQDVGRRIERCGGYWAVVRSVDDVQAALDAWEIQGRVRV